MHGLQNRPWKHDAQVLKYFILRQFFFPGQIWERPVSNQVVTSIETFCGHLKTIKVYALVVPEKRWWGLYFQHHQMMMVMASKSWAARNQRRTAVAPASALDSQFTRWSCWTRKFPSLTPLLIMRTTSRNWHLHFLSPSPPGGSFSVISRSPTHPTCGRPAPRGHAAAAHTKPPTGRPWAPRGLSGAWNAGQVQTSTKIITWPDHPHLQAGAVHDGKYSWPDCSRIWRHCTRYSRHLESECHARWTTKPSVPEPTGISARAYVVPLMIHPSLSFCAGTVRLTCCAGSWLSVSHVLRNHTLFVLLNPKSLNVLLCFMKPILGNRGFLTNKRWARGILEREWLGNCLSCYLK